MRALMKTPDIFGYIIGTLIVLAFVVAVLVVLLVGVPEQHSEIGHIILGALGTMTATIVSYFFGSSAGSKAKTDMLAKKEP